MNQNLEDVIKNTPEGSVGNLYIADTLDSVEYSHRQELITLLSAKVRYGGYLELTGIDLLDLARAVNQGYLGSSEVNNLLFNNHRSASHLDEMVEIISKLGFVVINQRRNKYTYYIKAQRPE